MVKGWGWSLEELESWAKKNCLEDRLKRSIARAQPLSGVFQEVESETVSLVLASAGEYASSLGRLLAASALLGGAPDNIWEILINALPGLPLADWRDCVWRLAAVPCVGSAGPIKVTLLCGHAKSSRPRPADNRMERDSLEAVKLATSLASRRWGGFFICWDWSGAVPLGGASLGLPIFLAFGCSARELPMPKALATGQLNEDGLVISVGNVIEKAALADKCSFFIPEADHSDGSDKFLPVSHIDEAFELWECCGQGASPENLRALRHSLDKPGIFFSLLLCCTPTVLKFIHRPERIKRLRAALKRDPSGYKDELRTLLMRIAMPSQDSRDHLRDFLLDLFTSEDLSRLAETEPVLAWRLLMLRLRKLNHSGHPRKAHQILEEARKLEWALDASENTEELISHALAVVGLLHNTYRFKQDPLGAAGPSLADLIESQEQRIARGQRRNESLGKWYGTLAQHLAFRGETVEAEKYLELSHACFEGSPEDQRQTLCYRFFVRMDAGRFEEALDDLLKYLKVPGLDAGTPNHIRSINEPTRRYAFFTLVRFAAETRMLRITSPDLQTSLRNLAHELNRTGRIWKERPHGHPWQLILYNLGYLAEDGQKREIWIKCLSLCLDEKAGPTMNAMALLPLAALEESGLPPPENITLLMERIMAAIREDLSEDHFKVVLKSPDWKEALLNVTKDKRNLFPFNYR